MGFLNFLTQHITWGIKRNEIVLDIGAGNNPILRADILVDKYVDSDAERYSGIIVDRPFVNADGQHLPFKDKCIDFIYCSYVLEHIPDPEVFLHEVERVSKRGVIVTPHGDYEKLDPRKMHLWYIWNKANKLILKQKHCWDEYPNLSRYFYKITATDGYQRFYSKKHSLFNTTYFWNERVSHEIIRDHDFDYSRFEMGFSDNNLNSKTKNAVPAKFKFKSIGGRIIRPIISSRSFD